MKSVVVFLFLIFSISCAVNTVESQKRAENPPAALPDPRSKQPVLVELFTSEGCSSCPPADRALAFLEKEQPYPEAEVITLALHVDYWDHLGWKDEFSAPLFTQRQEFYSQILKLDSTYTPQMIVDGRTEFVGSNLGKAAKAITEAAKIQKGKIEIGRREAGLAVKVADLPEHENSTVYLAITEDALVSNVARGENSGMKLEHQSVVRELRSIGLLTPAQKNADLEAALQPGQNWRPQNLKIVVFVQENSSRRILGVGRIAFEKN
jgi:hypothetical protein